MKCEFFAAVAVGLASFGAQVAVARTVDMVDFAAAPKSVHSHGGAKIAVEQKNENGVDYVHLAVTSSRGGWCGYDLAVPVPDGTTALVFTCRTGTEKSGRATITVTDAAGQFGQYPLSVPSGKGWGTSRVDLADVPFNKWKTGGKHDGQLHFPLRKISIDIGTSMDFSGYAAETTAGRDVIKDFFLRADPARPHGVHYPSDNVSYSLAVKRRTADAELPSTVDWSLVDCWRDECVTSGVWKVGVGALVFPPELFGTRFGSFRLVLAAGEGIGRVETEKWFARLTGPDPKPCPWVGSIGGNRQWDLLSAMGVGVMNCSQGWCDIEKEKGKYVFRESFDAYITNLIAHGIKPQLMTHVPNRIYENPVDPVAFAKYAAAFASHYSALGVDTLEIWNEPRKDFWKRPGNRAQYSKEEYIAKFIEFSRAARDAIKAVVPNDFIVSVCAEDMDFDLVKMLRGGIARKGDAISFHPYCHEQPRPERGYFYRDNGREIKRLAAENGGCGRFRITEFGWTTYQGDGEYLEVAGSYPRASLAHQAQYLVRAYLIAQTSGVDYSCQYRFEDMSRRDYTEHNFGFVFHDYTPKPSFCAVAFMTRLLEGAKPGPELSDAPDLYRVSSFIRGGQTILACWAVEKDVEWTIPESYGEIVDCFDLMGSSIKQPGTCGRILRLTERPVYLILRPSHILSSLLSGCMISHTRADYTESARKQH